MSSENLLNKLAIAYFVTNSLCLLILLELLVFKKSFLVLFCLIFYGCYKLNTHLFNKKIHQPLT